MSLTKSPFLPTTVFSGHFNGISSAVGLVESIVLVQLDLLTLLGLCSMQRVCRNIVVVFCIELVLNWL